MAEAKQMFCQRCNALGHRCGQQLVWLHDYWESKRGRRAFPSRSDIDPIEMAPVLANVFLVEVEADAAGGRPRFRYRLAGTAVDEIHGQSLTGRTPADIKTPEVAKLVEQQYIEVLQRRQPRCDHLALLSADGRFWHYERLILPLASEAGHINMLLCGIYRTEPE